MEIMLTLYTAGNFRENPCMRAVAKFCKYEQASTDLIIKIQTTKQLILLRFYFRDVQEQLKVISTQILAPNGFLVL